MVPLLNSSEPEDSHGHRKKRGAGDPHLVAVNSPPRVVTIYFQMKYREDMRL